MRRRLGIHRVAGRGLLLPLAPAAVRFGNAGPQVKGGEVDQHLITVVPLVRDDFADHSGRAVGDRRNGFGSMVGIETADHPTERSSPAQEGISRRATE